MVNITLSSKKIIRENQATVYLTLESLVAFQNWLNDKVSELETHRIIKEQTSDIEQI